MTERVAIIRDARKAIRMHKLKDKGRFGEDGLDLDGAVQIIELLLKQVLKRERLS